MSIQTNRQPAGTPAGGQFAAGSSGEPVIHLDEPSNGLTLTQHDCPPEQAADIESVVTDLQTAGVTGQATVGWVDDDRLQLDVDDAELGALSIIAPRDPDSPRIGYQHEATGSEYRVFPFGKSTAPGHRATKLARGFESLRSDVRDHLAVRDAIEESSAPDVQAELTTYGIEVTSPRGVFALAPGDVISAQEGMATLNMSDGRQYEAHYDGVHDDISLASDEQPLGHRRTGELLAELDGITDAPDFLTTTLRQTGATR